MSVVSVEREKKAVIKNKHCVVVLRNGKTECIKAIRPAGADHDSDRDLQFSSLADLDDFIKDCRLVLDSAKEELCRVDFK